MANSITSGGLLFPPFNYSAALNNGSAWFTFSDVGIMDADTEKNTYTGRIFWDGRPGSKIVSSAGGKIHFRSKASFSATTSVVVTVGIQDVDTVNGPPIRPDNTNDTSASISGDAFTQGGWNTATMTSGAKTLSHGELYSVVFQATTLATGKNFGISAMTGSDAANPGLPGCQLFTSFWAGPFNVPACIIEADDGTLGWFQHSVPAASLTAVSFSSGGANTEYGMRFVSPWDCEIDEIEAVTLTNSSLADHTIILYRDPNGTPVTVTAVSIIADQTALQMQRHVVPLSAPVSLTASTTYLLGVRSDVATVVAFQRIDFANSAYKIAIPGGTGLALGARGGGAGAFSMLETSIPAGFAVRINSIQQTAGGGGTVTVTTTVTITTAQGVLVHPSMTGGFRG